MKFEKMTFTMAAFIVAIMIVMTAWTSAIIKIDKYYDDQPKISDVKTQEAIQSSIELEEAIYTYLETEAE